MEANRRSTFHTHIIKQFNRTYFLGFAYQTMPCDISGIPWLRLRYAELCRYTMPCDISGTPWLRLRYAELCRYTMPCAIIALATFMKPATLAPFT